MTLLLRYLVDPHVKLSSRQRRAVRQRMSELSATDRAGTLISMAPGFAAILASSFWRHLARHWNIPWQLAFELTFALCGLALAFWLLKRRYQRFGRRAIRELGMADICAVCGYDLSGQQSNSPVCPECGARNLPMGTT